MTERLIRVLISLDCDAVGKDVLEVLTVFGNGGEVEITGLYVEDEDLLRAASLPGLREISHSGEIRGLDLEEIRRQMAEQANRAKARFEETTHRLNYKASFQIVRGRAMESVAAAAQTSDIVVIDRSVRSAGLRARLGTAFQALVSQHRNLLFVNEPWASGSSVVALCESPQGSCARALSTARRFAQREGIPLVVAAHPDADSQQMMADRIVKLHDWSEESIVRLCAVEDARLLVLSPSHRFHWRGLPVRLVDRLECSLLRLDE